MGAARRVALVAVLFGSGCVENSPAEPERLLQPPDSGTMVLVPGGRFVMGSAERHNQRPPHPVVLDAFYIDRCEVTNRQWRAFVTANPGWRKERIEARFHDGNYLKHWNGNEFPEHKGDHPVVFVSLYTAAAYAAWAGKRLPTEAEWERTARGSRGWKFAYGDRYDETKANTGNVVGNTVAVGRYEPNPYGVHDLTGNVMEWCADWYGDDSYSAGPKTNPTGPERGPSHVARGGSWNYAATRCTTSYRFHLVPPIGDRACTSFLGFRCARSVQGALAQD